MEKGKLLPGDLEKISGVASSKELIGLFVTKGALSFTISYAELSRRAGFKARSFPREVVKGDRSVNLKNIEQFAEGLRLNRELKSLLTTLVQIESTEVPEKIAKLQETLQRLRRKIRSPKQIANPAIPKQALPVKLDRWVKETAFAKVYAALGEAEVGATVDEIQSRTGLSLSDVGHALRILEKWEVLQFNASSGRYLPMHLHVLLSAHSSEEIFRACFQDAVSRMQTAFPEKAQSKEDLFFASTFSVRKSNMPELRQRMKELLSEFVEESETALGDDVVTLAAGLFRD